MPERRSQREDNGVCLVLIAPLILSTAGSRFAVRKRVRRGHIAGISLWRHESGAAQPRQSRHAQGLLPAFSLMFDNFSVSLDEAVKNCCS